MTDWKKARICWLSAAAGGRKQLPTGPRYSTIAKFNSEHEQNRWSVVIEFDQQSDETNCVESRVSFLAPEAPSHLLQPESQFQLMEGARVVAIVEMLPDAKFQAHMNGAYHKSTPAESEELADDKLQPVSFGSNRHRG